MRPGCAHDGRGDWRLPGSALWVCGSCHPPAGGLAIARRDRRARFLDGQGDHGLSGEECWAIVGELAEAEQLREFLGLIVGDEDGGLVEVRAFHGRAGGRVDSREWYAPDRLDDAVAHIARTRDEGDVFVGTAPRSCRRGGDDAVERGHLVSADLDSDSALDALATFAPQPSIVLASGSTTPKRRATLHAHWPLTEAVERDELRRAKAALAAALGSDASIVNPAGILRPPTGRNFKANPPTPVEVVTFEPQRRFGLETLVGGLPAPAPAALRPRPRPGGEPVPGRAVHLRCRDETTGAIYRARRGECLGADPLLAIPPEVYVERLLGMTVPRSSKVPCPFPHAKHGQDRTPSLHVYPTPVAGWNCFGCGRGGSIYDLFGYLLGVPFPLRGDVFLQVQR